MDSFPLSIHIKIIVITFILFELLIFKFCVRTSLPDTGCFEPFFHNNNIVYFVLTIQFYLYSNSYLYKSLEYLPVRDKIYPLYFLQKQLSPAHKTRTDVTART